MTAGQIKWAARHDWFDSFVEGVLWVWDEYTERDGSLHRKLIPWERSFSALRAWAGY